MREIPRTDLAAERRRADESLPGTMYKEEEIGAFRIARLAILDEESEEVIGRPCGRYVTLSLPAPRLLTDVQRLRLSELLCRELVTMCRGLTERSEMRGERVLFVGLGNARLTSDSLGPAVASHLTATAHLEELDPAWLRSLGCARLSVLTPGVLADSGMEAAETVALLCERHRPSLVIAVDALAARDPARLARTIQLCDTGITPGSGLGNHRLGLSRETLGAPVLSIGVPTVIDYPTEEDEPLFVTPKDIDAEIAVLSEIIGRAISDLLHLPA